MSEASVRVEVCLGISITGGWRGKRGDMAQSRFLLC